MGQTAYNTFSPSLTLRRPVQFFRTEQPAKAPEVFIYRWESIFSDGPQDSIAVHELLVENYRQPWDSCG